MWSVRESLPEPFWAHLQRELGREETLRILWPALVGPRVASHARFRGLGNGRLAVEVAERSWRNSLGALEGLLRQTINRFWGEDIVSAVQFVEAPAPAGTANAHKARSGKGNS